MLWFVLHCQVFPQGGVAHHRPLAPTPALKQCRLVVWQQIINSYEWPLMHLRDHAMCVFGCHSPAAGVMALHAAAIKVSYLLVANDHSWFTSAWRSVRMCGLYTTWPFPLVLCCAYHFLPVSGNTTSAVPSSVFCLTVSSCKSVGCNTQRLAQIL